MLIISAFYWGNFQDLFQLKALIVNILLHLRMSTYAYAYALVKTCLYSCKGQRGIQDQYPHSTKSKHGGPLLGFFLLFPRKLRVLRHRQV